jgi:phosphoribosylanthranilate isomerase
MAKHIIQIAGIKNLQEAEMLLDNRVDWLGYPLRLPVNKEDTTEKNARKIIAETKSQSKSVLITYLSEANEIIEFCRFLNANMVQLHGDISLKELEKLKAQAPGLKIIKSPVVGLLSENEIEKTIHYTASLVDYFITDTYNPKTGATGATGLTHDWKISKEIVKYSPKPVILAGGLNPDNIAEAIKVVQPFGVDAHTGVENELGDKDEILVFQFVKNASKAFAELSDHDGFPLPITDTLDLHTFHPRDVKSLVHEFVAEAKRNNIKEVRIVHGKGKGVLQDIVHNELAKNEKVMSFKLANDRFSSWGATVVKLKK